MSRVGWMAGAWASGVILGLLPATGMAQAPETLISRTYVRAEGTPVTATDAFTTCDPTGQFTLAVDNGPGGEPG